MGQLDNQVLKRTQTGVLPAANAWFNSPGMGYYPNNPIAGINQTQQQGWGALMGGANQASQYAQQFGGAFMNAFNNPYNVNSANIPQVGTNQIGMGPQSNAQQIGMGPQSNAQQIGMGPMTQAGMIGQGPQVSGSNVNAQQMGRGQQVNAQQIGAAPQVGEASMNMFQNPYLTKSIQAGMGQNNKNFKENVLTGLDAGAIGSGMSGSSRHGLAQGTAMSNLNQQNLDMSSQMNERAYNQGMSNFLGQRQQNLGAQTTNAGNWLQSQGMNQGANLQAQGMNQGDAFNRAQANQGANLQGQLANQSNSLQAQGMNQNQWMQGQLANQSMGLQSQMANQGAWGQNSRANQSMNLQGQMSNQGAWGQNARANQSMNLQGQMSNQSQWGQNARANAQNQLNASGANASNWLGAEQGNQRNMSQMMGYMPGMTGAMNQGLMAPGTAMAQIGQQQQNQAQNQINAQMAQWNWMQQQPYQRMNQYAGLVNSTQGSALPGYNPPPGPNWGAAAAGLGNAAMNINWGGMGGQSQGPASSPGTNWFPTGGNIGYMGGG